MKYSSWSSSAVFTLPGVPTQCDAALWPKKGLRAAHRRSGSGVRLPSRVKHPRQPLQRNLLPLAWPRNDARFAMESIGYVHALGLYKTVRWPDIFVITYRLAEREPRAAVNLVRSAAEGTEAVAGFGRVRSARSFYCFRHIFHNRRFLLPLRVPFNLLSHIYYQ